MSMATALNWDSPIPLWIDSLNIDMDEEMPVSDLMVTIPSHDRVMGGTPACTPVSTKQNSFLITSASATEQQAMFGPLQTDKLASGNGNHDSINITLNIADIKIVAESPTKTKSFTTQSPPRLSPVKGKPTAKPARCTRRKVRVDPSGSKQHRKDKQRGYEKVYRNKQKSKRAQDISEWIYLETQIRKLLAKRTSVLVLGALAEPRKEATPSTVSIRQRYYELLQEERALRESEALDSCELAGYEAMRLWGGATAASRDIRAQMNALPSLATCHTFEFSW
ncbi:unnamed protein product [Phytophthora lilii]|uniref:Unnamed protein product n=1 Tax=Phytophthora lilii TaxID=2077276 RepID=A0A9W6X155_9STRA|nr:unnamed protein product [Phytophthora lilii]